MLGVISLHNINVVMKTLQLRSLLLHLHLHPLSTNYLHCL
jgi:hypothetical protein